jgi:hypothetical protein
MAKFVFSNGIVRGISYKECEDIGLPNIHKAKRMRHNIILINKDELEVKSSVEIYNILNKQS